MRSFIRIQRERQSKREKKPTEIIAVCKGDST